VLTVERIASGIELTVEGIDTGPAAQNLAYRAAEMVLSATGKRFGVRMHLEKRIPVMAGLGGGSSDGAAALAATNHLADNAVPRHELIHFAAKLGSDVPFFASGAAFALAWGRGERLFRLHPPTSAPALVVVPPFGVSTKEAYDMVGAQHTLDARRGPVVLEDTAFDAWGNIGRLGGNDFESVVFAREAALRDLFERMAETRPLLVRLSGTGSAVIAIYKSVTDRDSAAEAVGSQLGVPIHTETRQASAAGPVALADAMP